jgi:hypothetical protein
MTLREGVCPLGPYRRCAAGGRGSCALCVARYLEDRSPDACDRLEGALAQQVVGYLDLELVFEGEHHVDRAVRGQADPVEVVVVPELGRVDRQAPVFGQDRPDRLVHRSDNTRVGTITDQWRHREAPRQGEGPRKVIV